MSIKTTMDQATKYHTEAREILMNLPAVPASHRNEHNDALAALGRAKYAISVASGASIGARDAFRTARTALNRAKLLRAELAG